MEELEEGELEGEVNDVSLSDCGYQPSSSDQTRLRLQTDIEELEEELEEGEIPDEKEDGNLSDISDNEGVWNTETVEEQACHSKTSETQLRHAGKSDSWLIVENSSSKAKESEGKISFDPKVLQKWLHSQSGFQEDKDQWICGPEEMILWHGRKVSVVKAASELPEELFLAFEDDLNKLLQLSSFGGVRCDKLMDDYKEKLPSSAKEFKRIARMNYCSSTTLVKICLSYLQEKFEVFQKRCWNGDGRQSSDTAVIQRKISAVIQRKMRKWQEGSAEEKREFSGKEVMVIATNVSGRVKWFDANSGHGCVTRDDNKEDVLVHHTALINSTPERVGQSLRVGEIVAFDVVIREKRIEASNVSRRGGTPNSTDHKRGEKKKYQIEEGVQRRRHLFEELDRELAAEIEVVKDKIKTDEKNSRDALTRENENNSRQTVSQSIESKIESGQSKSRQTDCERSRSTKEEDEEERKSGKRKRSESSHSGRQKKHKRSRGERSSSRSNGSGSNRSRKRKRSNSTEKISANSKERESESSRGRKSKEKKRLKEDERKKPSEEPEQKDTVAKFPNKKIGAMVTDAAIQRILRVGLVYDTHSFMYQWGPLGPNLYIFDLSKISPGKRRGVCVSFEIRQVFQTSSS